MNKLVWSLAVAALSLVGCEKNSPAPAPVAVAVNAEEKVLNIYNWPDYIAQDMVADFITKPLQGSQIKRLRDIIRGKVCSVKPNVVYVVKV